MASPRRDLAVASALAVIGTMVLGVAASVATPPVLATSDTYPRQPAIDVLHYVFRLTLTDDHDTIDGWASIDVRFRESGATQVVLDLASTSASRAPHGMTVSGVRLERVGAFGAIGVSDRASSLRPLRSSTMEAEAATAATAPRGVAASYDHRDDRLLVRLLRPAEQGDRIRIHVVYSGSPDTGLRIGPNKHGERTFFSDNWPTRAHHWLPTVDHPSDKATSEMIVDAPAHYQVISNGLLVEETGLADGMRRTHWRQSVPIATWLNALGVARFGVQHLGEWHSGDGQHVPIQTWVYAQDRDAGFYDFAYPTFESMDFFASHVGPYSYENLANVQAASVGGGMESATSIFYGENSVTGERTDRWRNVIIHEIAHQWWGNAVTESDWDDVWLSEGFATYFTLLFIEHAYGRDEFVAGLRSARDRVYTFYADNPDYSIIHDNLEDMRRVTTGMQYQKGAWVLHMLRQRIDDETFWAGIRGYYEMYRDANASTDDFRHVMEEASGQNLESFFRQWLYADGVPTIEGSWCHEGGALVIELSQVQATQRALTLPLEIELHFDDGESRREVLEIVELSQTFTLEVDRAPTRIELDPATKLLVRGEIESNS